MQTWSACICCTEAAVAFLVPFQDLHLYVFTIFAFFQSVCMPTIWILETCKDGYRLQKRPCICIMTRRSDLVPGARLAYAIVWICKSKCAQSTFQSEADAQIFIAAVSTSASKSSIRRFVITEKAPTRAFSWLKAATATFTIKTLLRHYARQTLTPR